MATIVQVVEADWPQIYMDSETYAGNVAHANELGMYAALVFPIEYKSGSV